MPAAVASASSSQAVETHRGIRFRFVHLCLFLLERGLLARGELRFALVDDHDCCYEALECCLGLRTDGILIISRRTDARINCLIYEWPCDRSVDKEAVGPWEGCAHAAAVTGGVACMVMCTCGWKVVEGWVQHASCNRMHVACTWQVYNAQSLGERRLFPALVPAFVYLPGYRVSVCVCVLQRDATVGR